MAAPMTERKALRSKDETIDYPDGLRYPLPERTGGGLSSLDALLAPLSWEVT